MLVLWCFKSPLLSFVLGGAEKIKKKKERKGKRGRSFDNNGWDSAARVSSSANGLWHRQAHQLQRQDEPAI